MVDFISRFVWLYIYIYILFFSLSIFYFFPIICNILIGLFYICSFHGRSLLDILNTFISRSFSPEIQLCAAKCLTYIYRSGTLLSSDFRILHRTLPSLVRLCSENYNLCVRGSAAETLAYLIEVKRGTLNVKI